MWLIVTYNPFQKKSCKKPCRSIIQTNQPLNGKSASAVIPWTHVEKSKKRTGKVFCSKNTNRINTSPKQHIPVLHDMINRLKQSGHAIDGEHDQGSGSGHLPVIVQQRTHTGPEYFDTPAHKTAADEISYVLLHDHSITKKQRKYVQRCDILEK